MSCCEGKATFRLRTLLFFEALLQTLGLVDRKDPMTEMAAKKLVELAGLEYGHPIA
jgi:hypothetical protein